MMRQQLSLSPTNKTRSLRSSVRVFFLIKHLSYGFQVNTSDSHLCKHKKRVYFADLNAVYDIPSLDDLEYEGVLRDLWYTRYPRNTVPYFSTHPNSRRDFHIFKVAAYEELHRFMQTYGLDTHSIAVMYLYQPDSIIESRTDLELVV